MRFLKPFAATLVLLALAAGVTVAAEKAAKPHDVAVFSVPGLDKGATLKGLAKALAGQPGVVKAKADKKAGTFNVTFDREATDPGRIQQAVGTVAKDATLVSVRPADPKAAAAKGCGGCPQAKSCPGKK
jgi:hypothetical protein